MASAARVITLRRLPIKKHAPAHLLIGLDQARHESVRDRRHMVRRSKVFQAQHKPTLTGVPWSLHRKGSNLIVCKPLYLLDAQEAHPSIHLFNAIHSSAF